MNTKIKTNIDIEAPLKQTEAGMIVTRLKSRSLSRRDTPTYREMLGFSPLEASQLDVFQRLKLDAVAIARLAGREESVE